MTDLYLFLFALLVAIPLVKWAVDKIRWAFRRGCGSQSVSYEWQINNDEHD